MKHPFALLAPLVFLFVALAACTDVPKLVEVEITLVIDCPLPIPTITDPDSLQLATWYNGLCAFYWEHGDTVEFVQPGVVG